MTGAPRAAERGENQVRQLAFVGGLAGFDRDELGEELRFVDVQAAALGIGEAPGADLGRAAVIDRRGRPRPIRSARASMAHCRPARRRR